MQTDLSPQLINHPEGIEAQKLLANCVHCGFCTATCPTYQILGDELDGPRGRIYLIKQMAEGKQATAKTRLHLDRCLTCRNCESTCPSGVQYGHLLDIGRKWAEEQTPPRPIKERAVRWLLKETLTRSEIFDPAMKIGRAIKPLLPSSLQKKIPTSYFDQDSTLIKTSSFATKMLFLEGCVQPGMLPNINQATRRVFQALNIELIAAPKAGCCGALRHHLNDHDAAKNEIRKNIDAWIPIIAQEKISAIVMNASGCGVMVKDYAYLLKDDPHYALPAQTISSLTKDISEIVPQYLPDLLNAVGTNNHLGLTYHPPCTLQHGQQIKGKVEDLLTQIGVKVNLCEDSHICCGSAGTYSILQESLSNQLRENKLGKLLEACHENQSKFIVSGNVGCITHLQNDNIPVTHWIEIIDQLLHTKYIK
jgi:glycolate oxidase iron-sulfur subunit